MKQIISARDMEEILRKGGDINSAIAGAMLIPSARDLLRDFETKNGARATAPAAPAAPAAAPAGGSPVTKLTSRSPMAELEAYFKSPAAESLKQQICEMGRRLWQRAYVDGNGGNMAVRVGEDIAICTPTLVSKGSLQPADLCLVDFTGKQLLGTKTRTSEILMHLQIMQQQPKAIASCHCHPPYATAFAIAGVVPPTCMIPEYEVFASVAIAPYRTPGTPEMGKLVADLADKHNTILMANHGVVSWSHNNIEEAYWRMEIIEAYCRTLLVAAQLGKPMNTFSPGHLKDLLRIKQNLGFVDPRFGLKECELCDNDEWRPGVQCAVPAPAEAPAAADPSAEAIVQAITEQVMGKLRQG